ncbi:MAG: VOC family protein [Sphingomonadaceae bacterium]
MSTTSMIPVIPKGTRATIIPCMRYRDAPAAIAWLSRAFGFEAQLVVPNEDGTIAHAQLGFGNGMIMLGSVFDTEYGRLVRQPGQVGNVVTQSAYLVVQDADLVYERAVAAGAEIVLDLKDEEYGGRGFSCRDPEGHIWSIGTYDPWD